MDVSVFFSPVSTALEFISCFLISSSPFSFAFICFTSSLKEVSLSFSFTVSPTPLNAKVNLIPYNKVQDLEWERPTEQAQDAFLESLENRGVTATLRREKGNDIDAACGQLRLKTERELAGKA